MRCASLALAALLSVGAGCGSTARGNTAANDQPLSAVVRASLGVDDVRASTRVVHSLAGTKLKLRTHVRQTPDGSALNARSRITRRVGRYGDRQRAQVIVVDGKIFARGPGRWRRVEDTSPLFSYDEALALLRLASVIERLGADHYRAKITVRRDRAAPEPLNLLDEAQRREATVEIFTGTQGRLRRLDLSAGADDATGEVEASLKVLSFNEGLQVSAPRR